MIDETRQLSLFEDENKVLELPFPDWESVPEVKPYSYTYLMGLCDTIFKGEKDLQGLPYVTHCQNVLSNCMTILNVFGYPTWNITDKQNDSLVICCLFHDVIEDIPNGINFLKNNLSSTQFFENIEILKILTKSKKEKYDDYINRIINSKNSTALLVKFGDLIDHVNRLGLLSDRNVRARLKKKYILALEKIRLAVYSVFLKRIEDRDEEDNE